MIVSISRELGAGGGTLGEAIARDLGATLLDERWFIAQLAERYQFSNDFLNRTLEQPPKFGESLIATLARATAMMPGALTLKMPDERVIDAARALVVEQAQSGHVVVLGHGGVSMLGWRPAGVRVLAILLQAGRAWRIEQLTRRYVMDRGEAQRRVERTDEARKRYLRHYFDSDMYDSRQYDLVLNTERLGLDLAIALATDAARRTAEELAVTAH